MESVRISPADATKILLIRSNTMAGIIPNIVWGENSNSFPDFVVTGVVIANL